MNCHETQYNIVISNTVLVPKRKNMYPFSPGPYLEISKKQTIKTRSIWDERMAFYLKNITSINITKPTLLVYIYTRYV
jgi:hypothetical protein